MSAVSALTASTAALNAATCALLASGAGGSLDIPDWFVSILLFSAGIALLSLPFRMVRAFIDSADGGVDDD